MTKPSFSKYLPFLISASLILAVFILPSSTPSPAHHSAKETLMEISKTVRSQQTPPRVSQQNKLAISTDPRVFDNLDVVLAEKAQEHGVSGCSLVVFEGEEILYSGYWGTASYRGGTPTPVDEHTIYRVASVSKWVTSVLTMQLCEEGLLSLDDPLSTLLDPRLGAEGWATQSPTLRHLLTHTSGIIDGSLYEIAVNTYPFASLDTLLSWGSPFSGAEPGTFFSYSNFGAGMIGGVIEHATGQRFYDVAKENLLDPLGLDAGFLTDQIKNKESIASMGGVDPLDWGEMKLDYDVIPLGQMYLLAQGELFIGAEDLARIGMILAGDGTYQGVRYLTPESLQEMHTPYIYDQTTNITQGLGVRISDEIVEGVTLYGHQGDAYGAITCIFYDPETTRGVVFLSNGASGAVGANGITQVNNVMVQAAWSCFPQ